jgi:hypothetical protein
MLGEAIQPEAYQYNFDKNLRTHGEPRGLNNPRKLLTGLTGVESFNKEQHDG